MAPITLKLLLLPEDGVHNIKLQVFNAKIQGVGSADEFPSREVFEPVDFITILLKQDHDQPSKHPPGSAPFHHLKTCNNDKIKNENTGIISQVEDKGKDDCVVAIDEVEVQVVLDKALMDRSITNYEEVEGNGTTTEVELADDDFPVFIREDETQDVKVDDNHRINEPNSRHNSSDKKNEDTETIQSLNVDRRLVQARQFVNTFTEIQSGNNKKESDAPKKQKTTENKAILRRSKRKRKASLNERSDKLKSVRKSVHILQIDKPVIQLDYAREYETVKNHNCKEITQKVKNTCDENALLDYHTESNNVTNLECAAETKVESKMIEEQEIGAEFAVCYSTQKESKSDNSQAWISKNRSVSCPPMSNEKNQVNVNKCKQSHKKKSLKCCKEKRMTVAELMHGETVNRFISVLTGTNQVEPCYICCLCGYKMPNIKQIREHVIRKHKKVTQTKFEGKELDLKMFIPQSRVYEIYPSGMKTKQGIEPRIKQHQQDRVHDQDQYRVRDQDRVRDKDRDHKSIKDRNYDHQKYKPFNQDNSDHNFEHDPETVKEVLWEDACNNQGYYTGNQHDCIESSPQENDSRIKLDGQDCLTNNTNKKQDLQAISFQTVQQLNSIDGQYSIHDIAPQHYHQIIFKDIPREVRNTNQDTQRENGQITQQVDLGNSWQVPDQEHTFERVIMQPSIQQGLPDERSFSSEQLLQQHGNMEEENHESKENPIFKPDSEAEIQKHLEQEISEIYERLHPEGVEVVVTTEEVLHSLEINNSIDHSEEGESMDNLQKERGMTEYLSKANENVLSAEEDINMYEEVGDIPVNHVCSGANIDSHVSLTENSNVNEESAMLFPEREVVKEVVNEVETEMQVIENQMMQQPSKEKIQIRKLTDLRDLIERPIASESMIKAFVYDLFRIQALESGRLVSECKLCAFKTSYLNDCVETYSELLKHQQLKHFKTVEKTSCMNCMQYFCSRLYLKHHYETVHRNEYSPYSCEACGLKFSNIGKFQSHMIAVHSITDKIRCTEQGCDFITASENGLRVHIKTHAKNVTVKKEAIQSVCELCGTSSSLQNGIELHQARNCKGTLINDNAINRSNQRYICTPCNKVFPSLNVLKIHERMLHNGVNECPFEGCGRVYKELKALSTHINKEHYKRWKVKCPDCASDFADKSSLLLHQKTVHLGIKDFACNWPECNRKFGRKRALEIHYRLHTGEKKFACEYCDYRGMQRGSLNYHMKRMHPGQIYNR